MSWYASVRVGDSSHCIRHKRKKKTIAKVVRDHTVSRYHRTSLSFRGHLLDVAHFCRCTTLPRPSSNNSVSTRSWCPHYVTRPVRLPIAPTAGGKAGKTWGSYIHFRHQVPSHGEDSLGTVYIICEKIREINISKSTERSLKVLQQKKILVENLLNETSLHQNLDKKR